MLPIFLVRVCRYFKSLTSQEDHERELHDLSLRPDHDASLRLDLTHLHAFAIDCAKTRVVDDAVSVERLSTGLRLWVHISDPTRYIDQSAYEQRVGWPTQSNSRHNFQGKLAREILSLGAQQESCAISIGLPLDGNGRVDESVTPTVTLSRVSVTRLSLSRVGALLSEPVVDSMGGGGEAEEDAETVWALHCLQRATGQAADGVADCSAHKEERGDDSGQDDTDNEDSNEGRRAGGSEADDQVRLGQATGGAADSSVDESEDEDESVGKSVDKSARKSGDESGDESGEDDADESGEDDEDRSEVGSEDTDDKNDAGQGEVENQSEDNSDDDDDDYLYMEEDEREEDERENICVAQLIVRKLMEAAGRSIARYARTKSLPFPKRANPRDGQPCDTVCVRELLLLMPRCYCCCCYHHVVSWQVFKSIGAGELVVRSHDRIKSVQVS